MNVDEKYIYSLVTKAFENADFSDVFDGELIERDGNISEGRNGSPIISFMINSIYNEGEDFRASNNSKVNKILSEILQDFEDDIYEYLYKTYKSELNAIGMNSPKDVYIGELEENDLWDIVNDYDETRNENLDTIRFFIDIKADNKILTQIGKTVMGGEIELSISVSDFEGNTLVDNYDKEYISYDKSMDENFFYEKVLKSVVDLAERF